MLIAYYNGIRSPREWAMTRPGWELHLMAGGTLRGPLSAHPKYGLNPGYTGFYPVAVFDGSAAQEAAELEAAFEAGIELEKR